MANALLAAAYPVSIKELADDNKNNKLKACRAIAQALCTNENDAGYLRGAVAGGLHKPLVAEIQANPDSDTCRWACLAIFYLARDAENRKALGAAGAVHALVAALTACLSISCDTLVEPVVMAIVNLTCCDEENSGIVVQKDGVAGLLNVIRSGRGKQLCSSAALALSNVANSSEKHRHAVRDTGCVVPIVALLVVACKLKDLELMRNVCSFVKVLSRDDATKADMVAAGAFEALEGVQVRKDASPGIMELARQTSAVLAAGAANGAAPANAAAGAPAPAAPAVPSAPPAKRLSPLSTPRQADATAAGGSPVSAKGGLFTSIRNFFRSAAPSAGGADGAPPSAAFQPEENAADKAEEDELKKAIALSLADAEAAKRASEEREAQEAREMEHALKASVADKENWDRVRNTTDVREKAPDLMTQQDVTSLVFGGLLAA